MQFSYSTVLVFLGYDQTQVQLPAATKANTQEACADVKESGLFSEAGRLKDGELMSQRCL